MTRSLTATVRAAADSFLRLALVASSAEEIQWEAAPVFKPREDTDRKGSGGHGDPTGDIALDPRRLELREAVETAFSALEQSAAATQEARRNLEAAIARWHGEE